MERKELQKLAKEFVKQKQLPRSREQLIEEAKALDAKRSRERKTPTKEEQNKIDYEAMLHYNDQVPDKEIKQEVIHKHKWDVKIGDPIEFFDPNLSYELTGYRPISDKQGLDFDPTVFTVAADTYRKNGKYTGYLPGTFIHRQHWIEEFNRCASGYTVGDYTLTGENYFFLNYYRLLSVLADSNGLEVRSEDFPAFLAKQYEYFHYLELCRKLGKDGLAFKSRGVNKPALL